jgi:hypothetical protein
VRNALVAQIHDAPLTIVLAVTGGGVASIGDLLGVPGASRTVLEVTVPYASQALLDLIGSVPEQAVSEDTARRMATSCARRAGELADGPVAGVACTASLVTDRPKRGDHRAHVAIDLGGVVTSWQLTLEKGVRDRLGEDRVVSDALLHVIALACGIDAPAPSELVAD